MTKRNVFRVLLIPLLAGFAVLVGVTGQASATPDSGVHTDGLGATLTSASITFTTLDDNKDFDTHVIVQVKDRFGRIAAETTGFFGEFPDRSTRTLPLNVHPGFLWEDIELGGSVIITIAPNGNDTWKFGYDLHLFYSDGDFGSHSNVRTSLSEDNRTLIGKIS